MTMSLFSGSGEMAGDTEFRAFVTKYRAALTAAGFVRTSDTGQIDPTTVVRPGAGGVGGYEIWRFNDAAQATHPIFFKFEYGISTIVTRLQVWMTIGSGSNGAGTITGIFIARSVMNTTSSTPLSTDTWVSGGDGYLASGILGGTISAGASGSMGWMIDRLRLPTGEVDVSAQGAGLAFAKTSSNGWSAVTYDGAWSELGGVWPVLNPAHAAANGLYRGTTYAYPYHPIVGIPRPPIRSAICSFPVDTGFAVPFTTDLYGVPHTFRAIVAASNFFGRSSNISPALRYD